MHSHDMPSRSSTCELRFGPRKSCKDYCRSTVHSSLHQCTRAQKLHIKLHGFKLMKFTRTLAPQQLPPAR
jgi:hypothetical protein